MSRCCHCDVTLMSHGMSRPVTVTSRYTEQYSTQPEREYGRRGIPRVAAAGGGRLLSPSRSRWCFFENLSETPEGGSFPRTDGWGIASQGCAAGGWIASSGANSPTPRADSSRQACTHWQKSPHAKLARVAVLAWFSTDFLRLGSLLRKR